jgi:hypothetical protein
MSFGRGGVPDPISDPGRLDRLREQGELLDELKRGETPKDPSSRRVWLAGLILLTVLVIAVAIVVI